MNEILHPLRTPVPRPRLMNNPMDYELHPACKAAIEEALPMVGRLMEHSVEGKMFGVLVVADTSSKAGGELFYLVAYSGQIADRNDWEGFVPPVFDYLSPEGYFKKEEAGISLLNQEVERLSAEASFLQAREKLRQLEKEAGIAIDEAAYTMRMGKCLRDERRKEGFLSSAEQQQMVRESQYQKAELHRTKLLWREKMAPLRDVVERQESAIASLKQQRRQRSDALQQWLFLQFEMLNGKGERRSLLDIFKDMPQGMPPAGAGECCEPKLLQYAFAHHLQPLQMAMFWYGASPGDEIRHHMQCYPACTGKCRPILQWMLSSDLAVDMHEKRDEVGLEVVWSDDFLAVVAKPAGMLSVPGKREKRSVATIVRELFPEADGPLMVHRLDMHTSGLMVVAKTRRVHRLLQRQFSDRVVQKKYVALLAEPHRRTGEKGTVNLPLRPDILDRPRQIVDRERGKTAVTRYELTGERSVLLWPETGRTHQLRVHCAHKEGLGIPIMGDPLYGKKADRLYLHAEEISFVHPVSGERLSFSRPAPF
ncbi:MAG: RluA family pseudouridine synthase [Prevotella sp.]|nr:RluA family pseudouridine synthase [Prevotella sp.]